MNKISLPRTGSSIGNRTIELGLSRLRKVLIATHRDPVVNYQLGGSTILLPLSHPLPLIRRQFPRYSENIGRLAAHVQRKYPGSSIIDVGANVGDTAAIMRAQTRAPILCIDGDLDYFSLLDINARQWQSVYVCNRFVGETTGSICASYEANMGSGHIELDTNTSSRVEVQRLEELVMDFHELTPCKLVKIDTDGFEARIVRSSLQWLANSRPVLFIEYDPFLLQEAGETGLAMLEGLREIGYTWALVYENTGDMLCSLTLDDTRRLEELDLFYTGWKTKRYCDLAIFHDDDQELFEEVQFRESRYYPGARQGARGT